MIKHKVLIIDTTILCVWLSVPGRDICGPNGDQWNKARVDAKIAEEQQSGTLFVLPVASIIETGNLITRSPGDKYLVVNKFADFIVDSIKGRLPWAAFSSQSSLWSPDGLNNLAERWRRTALSGQSIGDASIVDVAEYYAQAGNIVEILTGYQGLKAYQPVVSPPIPRRRK